MEGNLLRLHRESARSRAKLSWGNRKRNGEDRTLRVERRGSQKKTTGSKNESLPGRRGSSNFLLLRAKRVGNELCPGNLRIAMNFHRAGPRTGGKKEEEKMYNRRHVRPGGRTCTFYTRSTRRRGNNDFCAARGVRKELSPAVSRT